MCFAISWNELFASAPFFLYAFALLLQAYLMKFLNGVSDLGINFSCCLCFDPVMILNLVFMGVDG